MQLAARRGVSFRQLMADVQTVSLTHLTLHTISLYCTLEVSLRHREHDLHRDIIALTPLLSVCHTDREYGKSLGVRSAEQPVNKDFALQAWR